MWDQRFAPRPTKGTSPKRCIINDCALSEETGTGQENLDTLWSCGSHAAKTPNSGGCGTSAVSGGLSAPERRWTEERSHMLKGCVPTGGTLAGPRRAGRL